VGGTGKDQPATSRRTASAPPTTTKYLAMGTAANSRELSNRGQLVAAMLHNALLAQKIDKGVTLTAYRSLGPLHFNRP
jgi:hypothetical protein